MRVLPLCYMLQSRSEAKQRCVVKRFHFLFASSMVWYGSSLISLLVLWPYPDTLGIIPNGQETRLVCPRGGHEPMYALCLHGPSTACALLEFH